MSARQRATDSSIDSSGDLDDPRVVAAVQEYLAALESGDPPARDEFLKGHPEIAHDLACCLEGLDFVHRAAIDMRGPEPMPSLPNPNNPTLPLGDFRIIREIGRGGMGVVYEAVQLSLGRRVALKVLPFASALDPKHLQRFKNEAQAAAQLHHTNIVPVYAVGSERGVHFYAMQLIEGEPLSLLIDDLRRLAGKSAPESSSTHPPTALATELAMGQFAPERRSAAAVVATEPFVTPVVPQQTPLPSGERPGEGPSGIRQSSQLNRDRPTEAPIMRPTDSTLAANRSSTVLTNSHASRTHYYRTVAHFIEQTASALVHAHRLGIIHRDIKPGNLIVDGRGNIWITDFGLAQFQAEANLTRTGDMLGTLRYMSPEQAAGNRMVLDHRADIYSLGVTLYELLTLEPVFAGSDRHDLMRRIIEDEPQAPRLIEPSIPIELETIVLKASAKAPGERYATAQAMADDLRRFLEDKPILARRPTMLERAARWRRRHRGLIQAAIVMLVLSSIGLLASTIIIGREHLRTRSAWARETAQRKAAEESFRQARQAVDTFTRLGEEEFANRPTLQPLRRKFLETSLAYYRAFLEQRHDDPDPAVRAELAAASADVSRILDELSLLQRFAPLMLLLDEHVQDDLTLSADDRKTVVALLTEANTDPDSDARRSETTQQQANRVLRETYGQITRLLSEGQLTRLQQIAWQQLGPFAFNHPEVIRALNLTTKQRTRINQVIEETRPKPDDHGPPGRRDDAGPPRRQDDHRPPGRRDDDRPPRRDDDGPSHKPDDRGPNGRPGFEQQADGRGEVGPPRRDHGPHKGRHGPPRRPGPHGGSNADQDRFNLHDFHPDGYDDHHGRRDMWSTWQNTIRHILDVLTPDQQQKWQALVGEPLPFDLQHRLGFWSLD